MNTSLQQFAQEARTKSYKLTVDTLAGADDPNYLTNNLVGVEIRKGLILTERLGGGASRVGYLTNRGTVIKVPHNGSGAIENVFEGFLMLALIPSNRTNILISRFKYLGIPCLEVERLTRVGTQDKDLVSSQWNDLSEFARKGLGLRDWLQVGFSPSQQRWVLTDIAPPHGNLNSPSDWNDQIYYRRNDGYVNCN